MAKDAQRDWKHFKEFAPSSVESESLRTDQNTYPGILRDGRKSVQTQGSSFWLVWSLSLFFLTGLLGCLQVVMNVNELLMRS